MENYKEIIMLCKKESENFIIEYDSNTYSIIKNDKNLKIFIDGLYQMDKKISLKEIDNQQVINFLKDNKQYTNSKLFINIYYWGTNLKLKNLLSLDTYSYDSESILLKSINPAIKNNLVISKKCNNCKNIIKFIPVSRTQMNEIIRKVKICDNCIEKRRKEQFELEFKEKQLKINENIKLAEKLQEISSDIVITKYKDDFYMDFESDDILKRIPNGFIEVINEMFKIDNIDETQITYTERRNKIKYFLNNTNRNIINNFLFANIYKYFTNLGLNNLDEIYGSVLQEDKTKIIIKIIDDETNKITYEFPITRQSSKLNVYTEFRIWLTTKFPNGFNFNNLFLENNFDKNTLNKVEIENSINKLKKMPYKEYLQTDHWKETRMKALKKARYKCEVCNSTEDLNVHHKTYENLGDEKPEDLIVLCHNCHAKFHNKLDNKEQFDDDYKNSNIYNYLKIITAKSLNEKILELNKLYGFDFIKDIHIDFNELF